MKGENQERRKRELWRLKGRIEREKKVKKSGAFFFVLIPTGVGLQLTLFYCYLD